MLAARVGAVVGVGVVGVVLVAGDGEGRAGGHDRAEGGSCREVTVIARVPVVRAATPGEIGADGGATGEPEIARLGPPASRRRVQTKRQAIAPSGP